MTIEKYVIISIEKTAENACIYRMEPENKEVLEFKPGQFALLHAFDNNGNSVIKRPYSIASAPGSPYLEFCIKLVNGDMTKRLANLKIGDMVGVEGPGGHFYYANQSNVGMIASGTGVAPMIGMLRYIAEKRIDGNFVLLYSTKTMIDIVYAEELKRIQTLNPKIKVVITLTREQSEEWKGEKGRINKEMVVKYVDDPKNADWWLCGSMDMVKSMKEILAEIGTDVKKIKIEGWG